jgi:hypothetical protein
MQGLGSLYDLGLGTHQAIPSSRFLIANWQIQSEIFAELRDDVRLESEAMDRL